MTIAGSCLCGGVRWECSGPLELMTHCHCSMCRKFHGGAFGTYVGTTREGFRITAGQDLIAAYKSSDQYERFFCSCCGSPLPEYGSTGERIVLPAGCLDEDPGVRPSAHIFVASKAPWFEIPPGLPCFDEYPESWSAPSVARDHESAAEAGWARGSCLCGDVAYEVRKGCALVINCHCSRCRKARGGAHASNMFVSPEDFRWLRGEDRILIFKVPEAERFSHRFCETCGSSLPAVRPDRAFIPMGGLDDDPEVRPQMHIFCNSKAPWYEIGDSLPQYEEYPSEMILPKRRSD